MDDSIYIERHIIIGMITSTEYLNEIRSVWNPQFLESPIAKRLSDWCIDYYDEYGRAPNEDIESIYFEKLKNGQLPKDLAEDIEEDILPSLSDEYERQDKFNLEYLLDRTRDYFSARNIEIHQQDVEALISRGEIQEAERKATSYAPIKKELESDINFSDSESLVRVERAFGEGAEPILTYPGALGEFLNSHLIREGFISFLAPEKRGKSFFMLDMARRAAKQRLNVAFFQAGDMSESQQIRRLGIQLAKKSDQERYSGDMWEPVKDCIHNQSDSCDLDIREVFNGLEGEDAPITSEEAREGLTFEQLKDLYDHNKEYRACHNCKEFQQRRWGTSWLKKVNVGEPLRKNEAVKLFKNYFVENNRNFMLSTHPNNTLSVGKMNGILDSWYRNGFVADLIVVDYADLLIDSSTNDFRQQQNNIWKGLRSLSEERHALVATATQADAASYEQGLLTLGNFSEDKRKFAHATAFFGLNQDPDGREKDIGIMRLNTLVAREGEHNPSKVVHVLQNLKRGQPILTSYW